MPDPLYYYEALCSGGLGTTLTTWLSLTCTQCIGTRAFSPQSKCARRGPDLIPRPRAQQRYVKIHCATKTGH